MRIARPQWVAALAMLIAMPVSAATFGELDAWCAPGDKGGKPTLCEGYLQSEITLLASPDKSLNGGIRVCVPENEDRAQIISLLRIYALHHPPSRDLDSVTGLGLALQGRFPCH
jgi:hypothetical protein